MIFYVICMSYRSKFIDQYCILRHLQCVNWVVRNLCSLCAWLALGSSQLVTYAEWQILSPRWQVRAIQPKAHISSHPVYRNNYRLENLMAATNEVAKFWAPIILCICHRYHKKKSAFIQRSRKNWQTAFILRTSLIKREDDIDIFFTLDRLISNHSKGANTSEGRSSKFTIISPTLTSRSFS